MAGRIKAGQLLTAVLESVAGVVILTLEDETDTQALVLLEHSTERQLVMGVLDRAGDCAAIVLDPEGLELLRDRITEWLERTA